MAIGQPRERAKRCLLIGAGGFLGSGLLRDLRGDAELEFIAVDRAQLDIRNPSQVKEVVSGHKPDVIVNVAGISSPASDDVLELYQINAYGHLYVLQAAAALERRPRVILASSAQLYGPGVLVKAKEQIPLNPVSHYGLSKYLAEKYCELFGDEVETVVVRIYNAIGRGQSTQFLLPKLVQAFRRRAARLEIGSFEVERDYIDTRDLSQMWQLVALGKSLPRVINFSNGETASLRQIISRLEAITEHRPEIVSKAANFRKNDISFQCGDNSVISDLGYVRHHSLDDTLIWMLNEERDE